MKPELLDLPTLRQQLAHALAYMDSSNVDLVAEAIEKIIEAKVDEGFRRFNERNWGLK